MDVMISLTSLFTPLPLPPQDLAEEQSLVARLVHNLRVEDPDTQFGVLQAAQAHFLR